MKYKLLPCPFCGKKVKLSSLDGDKQNWAIMCLNCGIPCAELQSEKDTLELLIERWNTRK